MFGKLKWRRVELSRQPSYSASLWSPLKYSFEDERGRKIVKAALNLKKKDCVFSESILHWQPRIELVLQSDGVDRLPNLQEYLQHNELLRTAQWTLMFK